jgi:uncharacterized membrane protein
MTDLIFAPTLHGYNDISFFWNILLILIPCLTVNALDTSVGKRTWPALNGADKAAFVLLFLFWLFFFPNTAYQFMVVRHLADYCPSFYIDRVCKQDSWLVVFFFTYALIGVPAFYYALNRMAGLWKRVFSAKASYTLLAVLPPLTTLGVMLGLFMRANSWDVVLSPLSLLQTILGYFQSGDKALFFIVFTFCLYLIYFGFDWFILRLKKTP